jgi:hypothetical protein
MDFKHIWKSYTIRDAFVLINSLENYHNFKSLFIPFFNFTMMWSEIERLFKNCSYGDLLFACVWLLTDFEWIVCVLFNSNTKCVLVNLKTSETYQTNKGTEACHHINNCNQFSYLNYNVSYIASINLETLFNLLTKLFFQTLNK